MCVPHHAQLRGSVTWPCLQCWSVCCRLLLYFGTLFLDLAWKVYIDQADLELSQTSSCLCLPVEFDLHTWLLLLVLLLLTS